MRLTTGAVSGDTSETVPLPFWLPQSLPLRPHTLPRSTPPTLFRSTDRQWQRWRHWWFSSSEVSGSSAWSRLTAI